MNIVFLGDSLTWGGYGGDFVKVVAHILPEHTVINAGIGGSTVINLLRRLDEVLDAGADVVFVMVGGNDAISMLYPQTRSYYKHAQGIPDGVVSPEAFQQGYRELLIRLQASHTTTFVGLPPVEYSTALVELLARYNALAQQTAETLNIPVLDLAAHFKPAAILGAPPIDLKFIQQIGRRSSSGWADYETERARLGYTFTFDGLHLMPAAAVDIGHWIAAFLKAQLDL